MKSNTSYRNGREQGAGSMEHGAWSMEQLMNMLVPEPVEGKKIKPSIPLMLFELSSKSYEGEEVVFSCPSTSSGTTLICHFSPSAKFMEQIEMSFLTFDKLRDHIEIAILKST